MNTATNEASVGWLQENCHFMAIGWHFYQGSSEFDIEKFNDRWNG